MKVLITGTNGFIGHHVVEHFLKNTDYDLIGVDKLSYAAQGFDRIRDIDALDDKRIRIFTADVAQPISEGVMQEIGEVDFIIHMAADSHVDKSIENPIPFVQNNVNNALFMLEYARQLPNLKRFIYFSTDEVYGTAPKNVDYLEGDRFNPGNPYSASKASAECLCYAYANTYGIPVQITNTMNVIGERQHPEKFFPKIINYVLDGKTLTIHSNKDRTEAGSRFYIHGRNVADALLHIIRNVDETLDNIDASKGKFNVVGEKELDNLTFAKLVAGFVGKELKYEMIDFHSSRPGHDLRYSLDGKKMQDLGWVPPVTLEQSIKSAVMWSLRPENLKWLGR